MDILSKSKQNKNSVLFCSVLYETVTHCGTITYLENQFTQSSRKFKEKSLTAFLTTATRCQIHNPQLIFGFVIHSLIGSSSYCG